VGFVCSGKHLALIAPDRGARQLGKILEALALTQAEGNLPLRALIETQVKHMVRGSTVVLITPSSSSEVALIVDFLLQRGLKPIVIILDASTFGAPEKSGQLLDSINMLGVPVRMIRNGSDISVALSNGFAGR
jgi:uncharacterized protein (DUF58 family)